MAHKNKIPRFDEAWRQIRRQIIDTAATEGVNFFKETFDRQGFTDVAFTPWEPKKRQDGYKILLRTGFLRNSIQVFDKNEKRIVFGSDAEYAEIHNEGGTITVSNTPRAKRFFWIMYKKTGQAFWKNMALSKKPSFTIHIPKRQFIGESRTLLNIVEKKVKRRLNITIRKLKHE